MAIFAKAKLAMNPYLIFSITSPQEFKSLALETFAFQYKNNSVYKSFCDYLGKTVASVTTLETIPFLPIQFFKDKKVVSVKKEPKTVFSSSGTTGMERSKHYVHDIKLYEESYRKAFTYFYGAITNYCVLALLPSYLEREGSSLIYMVNDLIQKSKHPESGFYLNDLEGLSRKLVQLDSMGTKILLIGVSFALLNLIENRSLKLKNTVVMETGGMKGRRKELIREELHSMLIKGIGVSQIHSEYGMTELLSQAYSKGNGLFKTPPWMQVYIRDTEDPLANQQMGKVGGVNIIDLANVYSCSFIATQDLGKLQENGDFELLGRFDNSDLRGCNLMVL